MSQTAEIRDRTRDESSAGEPRNMKNAKHLDKLHWFDISLNRNMAKIGYNDSNGHNEAKAGFNTLGNNKAAGGGMLCLSGPL